MKKLLPVLAAAITAITLLVCSTPAFATDEPELLPPLLEFLETEAADYDVTLLSIQKSRVITSDLVGGSSKHVRKLTFLVEGPGVPKEDVHRPTWFRKSPSVVQIRALDGQWYPIATDFIGAEGTKCETIDDLHCTLRIIADPEAVKSLAVRLGVVFLESVPEEENARAHYIFTPPLELRDAVENAVVEEEPLPRPPEDHRGFRTILDKFRRFKK